MNSVCRDFPLLPVCVFGPFRPASGEREDDFPSYFAGREGKKRNSAKFRGEMKPRQMEMMKREGEPRIKDRLKDIIKVKETTRSPRRPAARTSTQLPILSTPKIVSTPKIQDP